MIPVIIPFMRPSLSSFQRSLGKSLFDISRMTSPLITTARDCAPPFPPWLATMGMKTASTVTVAMVFSKRATTAPAKKAVARFIFNQGSLFLSEKTVLEKGLSSLETPNIVCMPAEYSSCMSLMSWLVLTMPTSFRELSITGTAKNFCLDTMLAASSTSMNASRQKTFFIITSESFFCGSRISRSLMLSTPASLKSASTT